MDAIEYGAPRTRDPTRDDAVAAAAAAAATLTRLLYLACQILIFLSSAPE